ncbi:sodium:solute symporter family protein [Dasania marina]|uniref:sodium:solute symporter family protein n=1 Tax=Dasania marina TaxID=471499 RepID=UPI00036D13D4|nr:sodium:solute symporter family protein [Dasania marina]
MDIFTLTIIVSIVIYIFIGNYAGRSVKQIDDYFVAGRQAPTLLIVGTLVASVMSSTVFLAESAFTYDGQMGPFVLFPQMGTVGYIYGALFFGRYLRRSRTTTVAAFFGERFNSHRVQQAAGLSIIVALGGYLLVVTQGAAILLSDLTALTYTQSLLIAWLSYTAFTLYSGSKGVLLTDTLMFLLFMVATLLFTFYLVSDLGGISAAIQGLSQLEHKADIASWHGVIGAGTEFPTAMDYLIWAIIIDISWGIVFAVSPWQSSRHLMAKNEHVVLRASIYACIAAGVLQVLIYGIGGFINLANPDITPSESAIIWAAKNMVPEFLGALLLAGIMAAALSSASTFLSLVGFSASNDIVRPSSPKKTLNLRATRWIMLAIGLLVLGASLFLPPSIFWLTYFVGTVFASSWGPVAFMCIWSKTITASGAFWGMISGFFLNVIPTALQYLELIDLPSYMDPILIGAACSLVVTVLVSRCGHVSRQEKVYRMRLHRTPAGERDLKQTKISVIAPAILALYGCVMAYLMVTFYVTPYQTASGQLLPNGQVDWATGEAFLSVSWALLYIPLALLTYILIWRSYSPGAKNIEQAQTKA